MSRTLRASGFWQRSNYSNTGSSIEFNRHLSFLASEAAWVGIETLYSPDGLVYLVRFNAELLRATQLNDAATWHAPVAAGSLVLAVPLSGGLSTLQVVVLALR